MTPMTQLGAGDRVLAVGAHPDDLEVGAGGLLARLARRGADVLGVVLSIPTLFDQRTREAHAGAETLGMRLALLHGGREGRVEDRPMHELVAQLDRVIADFRPHLVITHSEYDMHWDHGLVHRATLSSLRRWPCNLLAYLSNVETSLAGGGRLSGQCLADITDTVELKLAAIAAHSSQVPKIDLPSLRDRARAAGRLIGVAYAESYEVLRIAI